LVATTDGHLWLHLKTYPFFRLNVKQTVLERSPRFSLLEHAKGGGLKANTIFVDLSQPFGRIADNGTPPIANYRSLS